MELSENAISVLDKRYFLKDKNGKVIENWEGLCKRVSKHIASAETGKVKKNKWTKAFYEIMYNRRFLPNSPTLMNAGKKDGMLSACFVLPIEDSMESILDTLKDAAMIHKTGGGTGFDFSKLRPSSSVVGSTNGVASGPISFLRMYNGVTEEIKQGGVRRGANMGLLRCDHPNVLDFIECKKDVTKITNFNISVSITDKFMKAVKRGTEYDIIDPLTNKKVDSLDAREVFDKIVRGAWETGEPGMFFVDTVNKAYEEDDVVIDGVNPCLSGDTKISTIDGTKTFKELSKKGKDVVVHCWNPKTRQPELQWMRHPCMTRRDVQLIEIEFDSGLKVKCTHDHSFFVSSSEKRQAKDLKVGTEVFPDSKIAGIRNCAEKEDVYNGTVDNCHTYIVVDDNCNMVVSANCGETPLPAYDSCNLGSLNLTLYSTDGGIDWDLLERDIIVSVRFLDNIISVNCYPLEKIDKQTKRTRKIGLGIMGFADLLIKLGYPYDGEDSFKLADRIASFIKEKSEKVSEDLCKEKGTCEACKKIGLKRRNLWTTILAPTGTISMIAGCSSGIEPLFAVGYVKTVMDNNKLDYFHSEFEKMVDITPKLRDEIFASSSIQKINDIPKKVRNIFLTANDIDPRDHVKMQSVFQKHVHGGISKTINMPEDAKEKDVADAFMLAYDSGCKGVTVYRDGSRPNQVMSVKRDDTLKRKLFNRTKRMYGFTEKVDTALGDLLLTINNNAHGDVGETVLVIGKNGSDINGLCEGLGRVTSVALQYGVPAKKLGKQLKGIKSDFIIIHDNKKYVSIPDLLGHFLTDSVDEETTMQKCSNCGSRLYMAENCMICKGCGYSKC